MSDLVGLEYEGGLFTPGTALAEMSIIQSGMSTLDREIYASNVNINFLNTWDDFKKNWGAFYKENTTGLFGGFFSRALNKNFAIINDYRERLRLFVKAFENVTGKKSLLDLPKQKTGQFPTRALLVGGTLLMVGGLFWYAKKPVDKSTKRKR